MIPTLSIDNNRQRKILRGINSSPMKLFQNLYLMFGKIFDKFIPLFEQVISCLLQNDTIEKILQIQDYFLHVIASYNGPFHRERYVEGEYIDAGCVCFYKTPNVFTKDILTHFVSREKTIRKECNK